MKKIFATTSFMLVAIASYAASQTISWQQLEVPFEIKSESVRTTTNEHGAVTTIYEGRVEARIDPSVRNLNLQAEKITVSRDPSDPRAYMFVAEGKVTLNLGLRWDHQAPPTERFDRQTIGFDPNVVNPFTLPGRQFRGGLLFAGVDGNRRGAYKLDYNDLGGCPRRASSRHEHES